MNEETENRTCNDCGCQTEEKYIKFRNKKLTTMVFEIDITKCEKSFREILKLIQALENQELSDNDLEVKDIYFK